MADYPTAIYSPRTKENKAGITYDAAKTTIGFAEDIVKLDDEVVAIETELGSNPKGSFDDVKTRLDNLVPYTGATKNIYLNTDSLKLFFGAGNDASIYYNGNHMYINPKEVGSGYLYVSGDLRPDAMTVAYYSIAGTGAYIHLYNQRYAGTKGVVMYGYTPGRSRVTIGQKGYKDATFTLAADEDSDNLRIRRKWDGASTYSEAGALLKLERVITNMTAENGNYIEADDVFVLDKDGVIQAAGYKSSDGSPGITQVISILDGDAVTTHSLTFKNGLLTAYSVA